MEESTMGLSIKNAEVETMIRTLAEKRGISMTEAIRQALQAELVREAEAWEAEVAARMKALNEIVARFQALPMLDDRPPGDFLTWDENGLPA
jgi:antitoxin VapB